MNTNGKFIWRFTASHVISYFIAGIFAVVVMNYKEHYASDALSLLMRPVDSPMVALGPALQIFRGLLISLILLPVVINFKLNGNDIVRIGWLYFGISFLSTIGPAPGSFEGYVYTTLPLKYQLLGIPEALIYVSLFMLQIWIWYKKENKIFNIIAVIFMAIICILSLLGYLSSMGIIKT